MQESKNGLFTKPKYQKGVFRIAPAQQRHSGKLESEKPELSKDSYFETASGREFLKKEFAKIQSHPDCKDVELIQNEDKTIGITFLFENKEVEVRYPNDFSEENPNPMIIEKDKDNVVKTHIIPADEEKRYFRNPFDLFNEFRKIIFGFIIEKK